jgi:hypothetical protein
LKKADKDRRRQESLNKQKADAEAIERAKNCARGIHTPECVHDEGKTHESVPAGQNTETEPSDAGKNRETEPGDRGQTHVTEPKWQPEPDAKKGEEQK